MAGGYVCGSFVRNQNATNNAWFNSSLTTIWLTWWHLGGGYGCFFGLVCIHIFIANLKNKMIKKYVIYIFRYSILKQNKFLLISSTILFFRQQYRRSLLFICRNTDYRSRAIITRGLDISYPIFHCGLHCRVVSITDNLCTKKVNYSIFAQKSAVYNLERLIIKSRL